jgi:hypothetical protein
MAEAPVSDFFIATTLKNPLDQSVVVGLQKRACLCIILGTTIWHIIWRQLARRAQTDLVEHSAKVVEPSHLIVRAAEILHFHAINLRIEARPLNEILSCILTSDPCIFFS